MERRGLEVIDVNTLPVREIQGGAKVRRISRGEAGAGGLSVSIVHFPPGVVRPWSSHERDQYVWVLEGRGIIVSEDEENEVEPGMAIYIPAGLKHRHGSSKGDHFTQLSIIGGTNA